MRYTVTKHNKVWTDKQCHLLVYLKNEYNYSLRFIADVLTREFKTYLTKNACQGKYTRLKAEGFKLDTDAIKEYLVN